MAHHATDDAEEDFAGRAEVEGAVGRVGVRALAQFVKELQLVAVERARDVDVLAADGHNTLAGEELLGDDGRQPTEQVVLAVNNGDLLKHGASTYATGREPGGG